MKRILLLICLLILISSVLLTSCDTLTGPSAPRNTNSTQQTGIWVSGEGEVIVTPDLAILSLGVEAQADTVSQAQSQASTAMNSVLTELSNQGIEDKDIQTQYFNISTSRRWDPQRETEEITGYRVSNMVSVKVRNIDNTGAVIDAVAAAGGDYIRINNISFTVDDPAPYQEEARDKALADAQKKAEQIADTTGLNLGEPTFISETSSYNPYVTDLGFAVPVPADISESAVSISPGETTVRIIMQVGYSIE